MNIREYEEKIISIVKAMELEHHLDIRSVEITSDSRNYNVRIFT